jgi:hypothetical protein
MQTLARVRSPRHNSDEKKTRRLFCCGSFSASVLTPFPLFPRGTTATSLFPCCFLQANVLEESNMKLVTIAAIAAFAATPVLAQSVIEREQARADYHQSRADAAKAQVQKEDAQAEANAAQVDAVNNQAQANATQADADTLKDAAATKQAQANSNQGKASIAQSQADSAQTQADQATANRDAALDRADAARDTARAN